MNKTNKPTVKHQSFWASYLTFTAFIPLGNVAPVWPLFAKSCFINGFGVWWFGVVQEMPSEVKYHKTSYQWEVNYWNSQILKPEPQFSNEPPILLANQKPLYDLKLWTSPEESENLNEAIVSLESAVSSLTAQGPLSSSFSADVCGALADVYFEARCPEFQSDPCGF